MTHWFQCKRTDIKSKFILGDTLIGNEVGKMICSEFLTKALEKDEHIAAPEPTVIGKGLEHAQARCRYAEKGRLWKKVVIKL
jgi:hypothetical protein